MSIPISIVSNRFFFFRTTSFSVLVSDKTEHVQITKTYFGRLLTQGYVLHQMWKARLKESVPRHPLETAPASIPCLEGNGSPDLVQDTAGWKAVFGGTDSSAKLKPRLKLETV